MDQCRRVHVKQDLLHRMAPLALRALGEAGGAEGKKSVMANGLCMEAFQLICTWPFVLGEWDPGSEPNN
eukprot:1140892-Pelagomonas_calceolata.AAC.4